MLPFPPFLPVYLIELMSKNDFDFPLAAHLNATK